MTPAATARILERVAAALIPPPKRYADEWADQCRILPPGSPEPGPWRSTRTPYTTPIVRAAASSRFRVVVVVMGAQMGKTEGLLNIAGHRLDDDPAPGIYVGPTKSFVEGQIEPRFMAMVRSTPSLAAKMAPGKSANLKVKKRIAGVDVRLAWAGSATELAAMSAAWAQIDELDRMDHDVGGEGDPVVLVTARGSNWPDFTLVATSTPVLGRVDTAVHPATGVEHWAVADPEDLESPIWQMWQEGTRHEWAWPCPECGEYFVPRLRHLKWPPDLPVAEAARQARLCCPRCGSLIDDRHRAAMNAAGLYLAPGQWVEDGEICGDTPDTDVASFWVSGLCSPWKTWRDRARDFIVAVNSGNPESIKGVINTRFGELFSPITGEERPWESVAALREGYRFDEVPAGVRLITAGVDVQGQSLYFVVRGWGARHESWLIRHGVLHGDTANPDGDVWVELEGLLARDFGGRNIEMMAVDSGYSPGSSKDGERRDHAVYIFARRHPLIVMATRGQQTMEKPIRSSFIDITLRGKTVQKGLQLWNVDTDHTKSWVVQRLSWPKGDPGSFHLPADASDDYCKQLTAERRIVKPSGRPVWVRVRRQNHYLDCEALAYAAALRRKVHLIPDAQPHGDLTPAPPPPQQKKRQAYNWGRQRLW